MINTIIKHLSVLLAGLLIVVIFSPMDSMMIEVLARPIGVTSCMLLLFVSYKVADKYLG